MDMSFCNCQMRSPYHRDPLHKKDDSLGNKQIHNQNMAVNDIFGNLEEFLENYDDNYRETSILSDAENNSSSFKPSDQSSSINRNSCTVNKPTQNTITKTLTNTKITKTKFNSGASLTPSAVATISELHLASSFRNVVDLTSTADLSDRMEELSKLFHLVFCNKDPMVKMHIKSHRLFNSTKRSYNSLCNSVQGRAPTKLSEQLKLKNRIANVYTKLVQLQSSAECFLLSTTGSSTSRRCVSERRGRSRRRDYSSTADEQNVIILDDDQCDTEYPGEAIPAQTTSSVINVVDPNVIMLDSDDEDMSKETISVKFNNSFEIENYEMRIKIKWGNCIETYNHRKHQKFDDLITQLAAREEADNTRILLNLDDRIIYAEDTPDSIGYKTYQFISGRVLKEKAEIMQKTTMPTGGHNSFITLKVQLASRKTPLVLRMDKNQTMAVLVIKCAEELKCKPEDIKLYFDGDLVDNGSKPEDLELEGDEMLDVRFAR